MSNYIDKDELWERLKTNMVHHIVTNTLFNTIKAVIDGMPTIEVSEDCISREGLSYKVGRYFEERGDFGSFECFWILGAIRNAPSVVLSREEPKRGVWIKKEHLVPLARDADPLEWDKYDEKTHSELEEYWHCSECDYEGDRHFRPLWNYYPNCGAKMIEE